MIRSALVVLAAFVAVSLLPYARASDAPAAPAARSRADVHFLAGYDHYRAGRLEDARREWSACRELDEKHDFCEFGLSALDAGAPRDAAAPEAPAAEAPVTAAPPAVNQDSSQAYLEGVIYYQKGDYEKARAAWTKAKQLAPADSKAADDAAAGLKRINQLYGPGPEGDAQAPKSLKEKPDPKDEHEALQAYFTGMIFYQKGDSVRARTEWTRARALAPKDSVVESDSKAALDKLDLEQASTRRDGKK